MLSKNSCQLSDFLSFPTQISVPMFDFTLTMNDDSKFIIQVCDEMRSYWRWHLKLCSDCERKDEHSVAVNELTFYLFHNQTKKMKRATERRGVVKPNGQF